jgi:hypothetical protein
MESLVAIGVIAGILIVLRVGFQWLGEAGSASS